MPESTEREIQPQQVPGETDEGDFFIRLAVTRGRKFYGGREHRTHREIAEVLTEYSTRSHGVLREVFSLLAKFHLQAVEEVPGPYQNATGAYSNTDTVQYGPCPSPGCPTFPDGSLGATMTIISGKVKQVECYACFPTD
jgi:hypothetical protein